MHPLRVIRKQAALGLVTTAVMLSGCAQTKTAEAEKKDPAKQETYTQVNSTGSWIPRKVKKKEDLIGDQTQVAAPSALDRAVAAGDSRVAKDPPATTGK